MRWDSFFRETGMKIYLLIFCAAFLLWTCQGSAQGEAFIFVDPVFGNFRYKTVDVERIVDDIKRMGVTDIIVEDSLSGTVAWESSLPGVVRDRNLAGEANKRFFDRLVMKDGVISERGTHEELIAKDGLYREIYDLELRDQEEALKRAAEPRAASVDGAGAG